MTSVAPQTPPSKALPSATNTLIYPSPSLSPVTSFRSVMDSISAENRRISSVKSLMASANPPASPLDALVMALEATAEEIKDQSTHDQIVRSVPASQEPEEEDPNATVPSSPTLFMKRPLTSVPNAVPSLHQLPSLVLPEAAVFPRMSSASSSHGTQHSVSVNLTPSTHPGQANSQRKMSFSSQGSADSATSVDSNGEHRKTFACSVGNCEKKFSQVAHLRIHERCHTGTRPFVCRFDGCERSFTQLGNLKTHERKHTGERPFKCGHPGCDKTFTQLGNLKTHEHIHDEVKPFMCRLAGCGKAFSQLGNLKTHTAKMHPDVNISDEELAVKTAASTSPTTRAQASYSGRTTQEQRAGQVVAHFHPYQRRPVGPQWSEKAQLLRDIQTMIRYQEQHALDATSESEASESMEE